MGNNRYIQGESATDWKKFIKSGKSAMELSNHELRRIFKNNFSINDKIKKFDKIIKKDGK